MRSFTALVNPISGGGTAAAKFAPLADRIREAGAAVEIVATQSQQHAVDSARDASAKGDVVVAVGGDGLVRDVAEGVVGTGGTMAIVPAGRGNDFALRARDARAASPSSPTCCCTARSGSSTCSTRTA